MVLTEVLFDNYYVNTDNTLDNKDVLVRLNISLSSVLLRMTMLSLLKEASSMDQSDYRLLLTTRLRFNC